MRDWIKSYWGDLLFVLVVAVLCVLFYNIGRAMAEETVCFKPAPEPVYTVEKDYGYLEDVPCNDEAYPHSLMKTWQNGGTRYIFVDFFKDGICDVVSRWNQPDRSENLWTSLGVVGCEEMDQNIETQIRFKKSLEGSE